MAKKTTINVQLVHDADGNLVVQPATKADGKRIEKKLKSFKGSVGAIVEGDPQGTQTVRFFDMSSNQDPVLSSAIWGGLGSVAGAIPGVLLASPVAIWAGWTAGGALGARAGAPKDRKGRAAWGGGIGGALGGPVGSALGGALGSRKKDKNPASTKALKNKLMR